MQRLAVVTEACGDFAVVEVSRETACESCHSREGCTACIVLSENRAFKTRARNEAHASVGDRVMIETESTTVIGYAAAVFLLPLVLAGLGWFIGGLFGEGMLPAVSALIGFAAAFAFLYFVLDRSAARRVDVRIVRIIKGDSVNSETETD